MAKLMTDIRADRAKIEQLYVDKFRRLEEDLGGYERDDKLHRLEIDALKRVKEKGCLLSDEELQAHPVSPKLRSGFTGRVHDGT
jgi:hypothetical protein